MRSGWPEEYSAWNITFQDWQIMRRRADRFLGGELGAAAIDGRDAAALEFAQAVLDGVEIVVHETEKDPPDHEAETGKGRHGCGLEVAGRVLRLELAPLLERAAVQQFAEAALRARTRSTASRSCGSRRWG